MDNAKLAKILEYNEEDFIEVSSEESKDALKGLTLSDVIGL